MQFSRLRLTGFKSFTDPTEVIISDGLTGVVGPNGCGKSNLLEALRWVMGENRPTAMRGGGMEDVIFAGAASRPARNYAEVALFLDNSDRTAPPAFNDHDQLEIIRRITRDAGSAYKANGKDCRARDVQMLFADASTGAHSPALVRQGQISELINAKPKARRRVLEEAAGISGLYQRRHEAELKLKGAETNLTRVDDVIEQLDSQLSQLARQAKQAARYRAILEDLRRFEGLLLFRRWREADQARASAAEELTNATKRAATAQGEATASLRARDAAEGRVPPLREEEAIAAAIVQRLMVERDTLNDQETRARDTIDTLTNRIAQLDKDASREQELNADATQTIERLTWEQEALVKASDGEADKLAAAAAAAKDAAQALQDREAVLDRDTEDVARLAARHQSTERRLDEAKSVLAKRSEQSEQAEAAVETAQAGLGHSEEALETASTALNTAQMVALKADADLQAAEAARSEAQTADSEARAVMSEADGEAGALAAEASALERVIARDTSSQGSILEQVRAARGYEAALGAALADEAKAPAIDQNGGTGWVGLPDYSDAPGLPGGADPLADHVTAPDSLHRRLSLVGLVPDATTGARLQADLRPGQRLVSRDGDLWRWDGYRASAADAPSAAALRLQQKNRLDELQAAVAEATQKADAARRSFDVAHAGLDAAVKADQAARGARKAADQAVTDATRAMSRAEADRDMLAGKLETLRLSKTRLAEETLAAKTALKEAEEAIHDLPDLGDARAQIETVKVAVEAARMTMLTKRSHHDELKREVDARTKRRQQITKEISGWRHRLETAGQRIAELGKRKEEAEISLKDATAAPAEIAAKRDELAKEIAKAEARLAEARDALSTGEGLLRQANEAARDAERAAADAREARARCDAVADAAQVQVDTAADRIREEMECSPEQLLEQLDTDPDAMPPADQMENDIARLRRQREALGAVNLRAEEDAREVEEERGTLVVEKADLEEAIAKLRTGIASLNKEGRQRLLSAFDEVNSNFALLFKHLFGGGDANLVLVESDDPLEAGLEIMCQPPGKKLSTLSLLSGGEQTLTALSLIFAVFLANPSPICVLDEVDAPLDDANVTRFCDLLTEMTSRTDTRFMIITHHAITMARMDRLFGVTMAEMGVSQLVSVDLNEAERMVEAS